jgi:peptide subunit release factor 1 (eRF1)
LLAQASAAGAAPADCERIERFFDHEYTRQGRGVACFSAHRLGFWRNYVLLAPVEDFVFVGARPYVKPLSDLWDNYARLGVVVADREGARVLIYHMGALQDSAGTLGAEVRRHKQGGWAAQKLQRYEDQEGKRNLKEAAIWAEEYLRQHNVGRVVLSGSDGNVAQLREVQPRALADKVIGEIGLDMNASPAEVWEAAFVVAQTAQVKAEQDLLEAVTTASHKGGAGAVGLADTLAALQAGRVYHLLLDRGLHVPGQQCAGCQAIVIENPPACPACGGRLAAAADAVDLALHRAIESGLHVSVLEPGPLLAQAGGIAAVLRY